MSDDGSLRHRLEQAKSNFEGLGFDLGLFFNMKGQKIFYLFLALLSPALVFVLLKMFGRNEFRVPILHESGQISSPANCHLTYNTPYYLPDSVMSKLGANGDDSLLVLNFDRSLQSAMTRVSVEFKDDPLRIISVESSFPGPGSAFLRECILLMGHDTTVALVDYKKRIRGYYNGQDRDEVDRLIVECKIILRQY